MATAIVQSSGPRPTPFLLLMNIRQAKKTNVSTGTVQETCNCAVRRDVSFTMPQVLAAIFWKRKVSVILHAETTHGPSAAVRFVLLQTHTVFVGEPQYSRTRLVTQST